MICQNIGRKIMNEYDLDEVTLEVARVIILDAINLYRKNSFVYNNTLSFIPVLSRSYHYQNAFKVLNLNSLNNEAFLNIWFKIVFDYYTFYSQNKNQFVDTTSEDLSFVILEAWQSLIYFFDYNLDPKKQAKLSFKFCLISFAKLYQSSLNDDLQQWIDPLCYLDYQDQKTIGSHKSLQRIIYNFSGFIHSNRNLRLINTI